MSKGADVWEWTLEALGPLHGYGIARRIEKSSENKLARCKSLSSNRRAKYYELTRES